MGDSFLFPRQHMLDASNDYVRLLLIVLLSSFVISVQCASKKLPHTGLEDVNFQVIFTEEMEPDYVAPPRGEMVTMKLANGKEYQCFLPPIRESLVPEKLRTLDDLREDIEEHLENNHNCLVMTTGWWTY